MNRLVIDKERCKACRLCIRACNKKLLELSGELNEKGYHAVAIAEMDKCIACAMCATVCPEGAIAVYREVKAKQAG